MADTVAMAKSGWVRAEQPLFWYSIYPIRIPIIYIHKYIYIYHHHHILYIYLFTAKIQVFPIEIGVLPRRIVHLPSFGMESMEGHRRLTQVPLVVEKRRRGCVKTT